MKRVVVCFLTWLCISLLHQTLFALPITDYKKAMLPDVDKPHTVDGDGNWQIDAKYTNTCAQAATTNLLWGAGYRNKKDGKTANNAQDLYESIVKETGNVRWTLGQEKTWMEDYFNNNVGEKNNTYKVITIGGDTDWGLNNKKRAELYKELSQCQFIELIIRSFDEEKFGHAVTLGGYKIEYRDDGSIDNSSTYIQDSDHDAGVGGYDLYGNKFNDNESCWILEQYEFTRPDGTRFKSDAQVLGFKMLCPVPEPCTVLLLGLGLVGVAGFKRKRRGR